jgi:hypothetical protein
MSLSLLCMPWLCCIVSLLLLISFFFLPTKAWYGEWVIVVSERRLKRKCEAPSNGSRSDRIAGDCKANAMRSQIDDEAAMDLLRNDYAAITQRPQSDLRRIHNDNESITERLRNVSATIVQRPKSDIEWNSQRSRIDYAATL